VITRAGAVCLVSTGQTTRVQIVQDHTLLAHEFSSDTFREAHMSEKQKAGNIEARPDAKPAAVEEKPSSDDIGVFVCN
jgi:hypothetical protein